MRTLLSALAQAYARWRFVEDTESAPVRRTGTETPSDEMARLRQSIVREKRNLESFRRFDCGALAGPCESSIRAMESRIRVLEMGIRRAV